MVLHGPSLRVDAGFATTAGRRDENQDFVALCCGARLENDPGHHHEVLDPRWSALSGLLEQDTSTETTEPREER